MRAFSHSKNCKLTRFFGRGVMLRFCTFSKWKARSIKFAASSMSMVVSGYRSEIFYIHSCEFSFVSNYANSSLEYFRSKSSNAVKRLIYCKLTWRLKSVATDYAETLSGLSPKFPSKNSSSSGWYQTLSDSSSVKFIISKRRPSCTTIF